jgi:hypothetical protein
LPGPGIFCISLIFARSDLGPVPIEKLGSALILELRKSEVVVSYYPGPGMKSFFDDLTSIVLRPIPYLGPSDILEDMS